MSMYRLHLSPDAGEGNGDPAPEDPPALPDPPATGGDPYALYKQRIKELETNNFAQRDQIRDLRKQIPKADAVVFSRADADELAQYRALAGKPDELKAKLAEHGQLSQELTTAKRANLHRDAAETHGYAPRVLTTLLDRDGLDIEAKDETKNGRTTRVFHVLGVDPQDPKKTMPLPDYIKQHWPEFVPSLTPNAQPVPGPRGSPPPAPGYRPQTPPPSRFRLPGGLG